MSAGHIFASENDLAFAFPAPYYQIALIKAGRRCKDPNRANQACRKYERDSDVFLGTAHPARTASLIRRTALGSVDINPAQAAGEYKIDLGMNCSGDDWQTAVKDMVEKRWPILSTPSCCLGCFHREPSFWQHAGSGDDRHASMWH